MARADDFFLTAEELRLRRRKRRNILLAVGIIVVALGALILAARPAANAIKGWQARRHAQKAFAFIASGKWHDARDEAIAAYQLRPSEPQALRAIARFLSRTGQLNALEFWAELEKRMPLSREDRRDQASTALAVGDKTTADAAIKALLNNKEGGPVAVDWLLAAQVAMRENAPGQSYLQKVVTDPHATDAEQFQATVLQLSSSNALDLNEREKKQSEAWQKVEKLSEGKNETSLEALVLLARRVLSAAADSNRTPNLASLIRALNDHPLSKAPHKLLALDLQIHANPSQREILVAEGVAQWQNADSSSLAALATWLNGKSEFDREIEAIPLERALENRELFLQHLDALGALGRWEQVRQLLEAERFPMEPVMEHMYLARCYTQLGQNTSAENNWQRALEAADDEVGKLMQLAPFAEKNGKFEFADLIYKRAIAQSPKLRAGFEGRARIAREFHDTKRTHDLLVEMRKLWPDDIALENDEAYTRLLLMPTRSDPSGISPFAALEAVDPGAAEEVAKIAERLVDREPTSLPHRTLLALARLRCGRAETALGAYGIQVPEEIITPSALLVRAATLAANGQTADARDDITKIATDPLLPEERLIAEVVAR